MDIPENFLKAIYGQAEREYPAECCGMLLGPRSDKSVISRLRPCRNAQDDFHTREPERFPRTARTGYFIDPRELMRVYKEAGQEGEEIRIIYHSHIDSGAHFSEEDHRVAAPDGQPAYPGVLYLVLGVKEGQVQETRLFHWDETAQRYNA